MAAHTEHPTPESPVGAGLLPIFAIATIVGIVAICVLLASPSTVAVAVALAVVIGFGGALAVLVSRLIGPEDH
jgi:hypothetical protein